eukprot:g11951.t1
MEAGRPRIPSPVTLTYAEMEVRIPRTAGEATQRREREGFGSRRSSAKPPPSQGPAAPSRDLPPNPTPKTLSTSQLKMRELMRAIQPRVVRPENPSIRANLPPPLNDIKGRW